MRYEFEGYVTDVTAEIYDCGRPVTCSFRAGFGESQVITGDVPAANAPEVGDRVKVTVEVVGDA